MFRDKEVVNPSILDRTALFRSTIIRAWKILDNCTIYVCKKKNEKLVYLKFKYAGNIQFHKIKLAELDFVIEDLKYAQSLLTVEEKNDA